ncbi:hypothetical protein CDAR_15491 [Caerostris darwini]|uniref:Uncharacterized protein n=1 Tax=Caerostris darwini TaxID=1538125 RepID=A0AAV4S6W6_9ARAC|nr:hypothetical protein CDAR_15491 [Caerostris darwini]
MPDLGLQDGSGKARTRSYPFPSRKALMPRRCDRALGPQFRSAEMYGRLDGNELVAFCHNKRPYGVRGYGSGYGYGTEDVLERNEKRGKKILLPFLHVRPHSKGRSLDDEDHNCLYTSVRYFHLPSSVVTQDSWSQKGVTCSCDTVNLLPKTKDKSCLKEEEKMAFGAQCGVFTEMS